MNLMKHYKNRSDMTKNEIRQCHVFPYALDAAITEKFGVPCKSHWNIVTGNYHTILGTPVWDEDASKFVNDPTIHPDLWEKAQLFVDGWIAGQAELRERLQDKSKWL